MKNKVNIKKIVGWSFFVFAIMWLIRFGNFGTSEVKESSTRPTSPTSTITAESSPVLQQDTGWKQTTGAVDYFWVTPEVNDKTTQGLIIENYMATYRILNTCIQQFVGSDGSIIASFKADVENRVNYLETPSGSGQFASEPWSKSEHKKAWEKAKWVKFQPLNQPLDLKVGRTK